MTMRSILTLFRRILKGDIRDVIYGIHVGCIKKLDLEGVSVVDLGLPPERSVFYSNSGGPELEMVFSSLNIQENDCILDIGCGKGGAMITMSKFPFRRVDGVEVHEQLIAIAKKNLSIMDIKKFYIHCTDAAAFIKYDDYNYIYMSHPFQSVVMRDVIRNIGKSIMNRPRTVTIVYKHPVCNSDIEESGIFRKVAHFNLKYPSPTKLNVYMNKMV